MKKIKGGKHYFYLVPVFFFYSIKNQDVFVMNNQNDIVASVRQEDQQTVTSQEVHYSMTNSYGMPNQTK